MEQNIAIANRLKALCEEKGLNYNSLAEKSGLPLRKVYRMMTAGASNPGVFTMIRLCKALGITLDEFFNAEEFQNIDEFRLQ